MLNMPAENGDGNEGDGFQSPIKWDTTTQIVVGAFVFLLAFAGGWRTRAAIGTAASNMANSV